MSLDFENWLVSYISDGPFIHMNVKYCYSFLEQPFEYFLYRRSKRQTEYLFTTMPELVIYFIL